MVGQADDDLTAVGVVSATREVAAALQELHGARHARGLDPLERREVADRQVTVAVQAGEHRGLGEAQRLVREPFDDQSAAQPHHRDAELAGEPGVGAGDVLDGRHVVSITRYLC